MVLVHVNNITIRLKRIIHPFYLAALKRAINRSEASSQLNQYRHRGKSYFKL